MIDGDESNAAPIEAEEVLEAGPAKDRVFHSGEKLALEECGRIMYARPTCLVVCAGSGDSGKTTFIARIREMFAEGSFKEFHFAGSLTLCAFERVSWLATITSGSGRPVTERSHIREKDEFFHLKARSVCDGRLRSDLLLNDLPGEAIASALQHKDYFDELPSVLRADHLTLFLDSQRLADFGERHAERDRAKQFLSRLQTVKHNCDSLDVTIVFSRWDYITRDVQRSAHEAYAETIEQDYRVRFGSAFHSLQFFRVAARPGLSQDRTDDAIQSIFARWLADPDGIALKALRHPSPKRDFSSFGLR